MKKIFCFLALIFIGTEVNAQQIRAYNAVQVMGRASSEDTVYIINFWATWCVPCVQELPEFNALDDRYRGKPVKILMVSLDFKDAYPYKLEGFLKRKRVTPEVAWLSDTNPNVFIPKIEETWEGSIPATLIIQPGHYRKFIEGQITARQIAKLVDNQLESQ